MIGLELTPEHPVSELSALAVRAEEAGFDTVFASHHYNNRDEFVALADIARATDEVRLGPGITNPYETHPVTLASRAATLDELADGRGVFGVGAGDRSTLSNLGYDDERPLRRVLETMQVARRLWDGERVDHDGTFRADDAGLNYDARRLPVYVGAQGPDMTRMAAKYADGVLFNGSHPRDIEWASDRVAEGLDARPDHRGEFDFAAYASVSVAEDADDAREAARPPVAFIAGSAPPPVLDRHDLDHERASDIGEAIASGEFNEAFGLVTPAMIDAFCIAGTPETVESRVKAVMDAADSVVIGSPLGPDLETAIDLAGEAVRRALA
ncbi:5,10-methylenetetrahydromethanopterin reductase [Salinibaculum rarum]|uniref:5,10-methylenetetrahydromethanopterin reductase n=1 Tax=Salinibaculum rarum TaxID=3058903 RepID=UPI00265F8C2B|nr:5,10-methylenetetrahydromethanopterin reductase [Salinibaculum sp. KK48]